MLRQSVRYCVNSERQRTKNGTVAPLRDLLPKLLDEHHLGAGAPDESRPAPADEAVGELAHRIFAGDRDDAARATAAALGSGFGVEAVGRALVGAALRLVLHDPGSDHGVPGQAGGQRARSFDRRSCLRFRECMAPHRIRHVAAPGCGDFDHGGLAHRRTERGDGPRQPGARQGPRPRPRGERREVRRRRSRSGFARAIRQGRPRSSRAGRERRLDLHRANPIFPVLFTHAVEDDGALHHEKFFATASEAQATLFGRPGYFECQTALARVVASGYGFEAPGLKEARERLLA